MPPKRKKTPEGQGPTDRTRIPEGDRLKTRSDQTRQWTDAQKGPMEKSGRDLTNWSSPVEGNPRITSGWNEPRTYRGPNAKHKGNDVAAKKGDRINTIGDGTVTKVVDNWKPGDGNYGGNSVQIKHPNGIMSGYMHLSKIDVHVGDKVQGGTKIGEAGTTGGARAADATKPEMTAHLHLRVDVHDGKKWQVVDPANYIKQGDQQPAKQPAKPAEQPAPPPPKQQPAKQVQGGQ